MTVNRELPRYQSHKQVWALKIESITGTTVYPADTGYAPFEVDQAYLDKHAPKAGGYFVVYDDGYRSWSPAPAFEDGYTRI